MNTKTTIGLIIVNDNILNNSEGDTYSSFCLSTLQNVGYEISRVSVIRNHERILMQEISFSNREFDTTIIIGNFSRGTIYQVLGRLFGQELEKNSILESALKKTNITFTEKELLTPASVNVIEGEKYPLIHVQRIFLVQEKYINSIFRSNLKAYLDGYQKSYALKKMANLYLNGNSGELDNLKFGLVKFELNKSSHNNVQLLFESDSLEDLLEFEEEVRRLVFVSSSKPILGDYAYSSMSIKVKHAIHVIETCFERYGLENTLLSFNGGKDCTVLLHLMMSVVEKHCPSHSSKPICLYVQEVHPFPEQEKFVGRCQQFYNLELVSLQMDMKSALKIILRDHPNLKACLMGTRKTDPYSQTLSEFQMTDNDYPEIMRVCPLLNWTYFDIWDYLLYYKIPYCTLYDVGYTSLGNVDNTQKNNLLLYRDTAFDEEKYLPAHKLLLESSERSGRHR